MQASWIDSDELRALAAGLQDPVEESCDEVWIPEPLLDETFIAPITTAFAPSKPNVPMVITPVSEPIAELQTLREQLRLIREEALAAGLLPVVTEEPPQIVEESAILQKSPTTDESVMAQEPSIVSATSIPEPTFTQEPQLIEMSQRLRSFQRFATELTACKDLLLMNKEGDLLWGTSQHYDIMATIMIAMRYHSMTVFEATHFNLTNLDDTLVVLSTPTRHGQVFLALINAVNTDEHHLQRLNSAMVATIEG